MYSPYIRTACTACTSIHFSGVSIDAGKNEEVGSCGVTVEFEDDKRKRTIQKEKGWKLRTMEDEYLQFDAITVGQPLLGLLESLEETLFS